MRGWWRSINENETDLGWRLAMECCASSELVVSDVSLSVGAMSLPQLVSPEEAAEYLGISAYTVRERLKSGEIPGRKHGARWLIRVVDLAQYVEPNNVT